MVAHAITFQAMWWWLTRTGHLFDQRVDVAAARATRKRFGLGSVVYPVLLGLSFVSAPLTLALHGVMAVYYAFNQVPVPAVDGRQPDPIALELDRGTEEQKRWRGKVAALAAWADGPYRQVFGVQTLTIAVVTPDEARRDTQRRWTSQELARLGQQQLAEIFLFTSADPVTIAPAQFFFGPCCYEPQATEPVSLLLPPPPQACGASSTAAAEAGVAGRRIRLPWATQPPACRSMPPQRAVRGPARERTSRTSGTASRSADSGDGSNAAPSVKVPGRLG